MPTILITGASHGLGLEFTRQYAADGWKIIATCRCSDTAVDLKKIAGNVHIRSMDITDTSQVMAVAAELGGEAVDVLLNNAGIHGPRDAKASFGEIDVTAWLDVMRVNVFAQLKVTEAFLDCIKVSDRKIIVFISSRAGSIAERGLLPHHRPGGSYIYRSSKAALNSVAQSLAFDLTPQGIGILVLHPGWVKTEMGGPEATIDRKTSVSGMRKVIEKFSLAGSGTFYNYDGKVIPW